LTLFSCLLFIDVCNITITNCYPSKTAGVFKGHKLLSQDIVVTRL